MSTSIRVGVVGTGVGVMHLESLARIEGVTLAGVCSAQRERAEATAARFGVERATARYSELLEWVDAVVITTPPKLHAPMTLEAIAAGKHVFCEKPLASSLAEARAMRAALDASGLVGMINFQIRFAPTFAEARRMQEAGDLGEVTSVDSRMMLNPIDYLQIPDWSSSKVAWFTAAEQAGGLLASSAGPHLIDFALWYGGPIAAVAARTAVMHPRVQLSEGSEGVEVTAADSFVILAQHTSGALSTIRGVPIGWDISEFTVEVHGTRGSVVAERAGGLRGAFNGDKQYRNLALPSDAYDRTVIARRFIDAIRDGQPSPTPNFADGVAAQAVIEAALASARDGGWHAVEQG